MGYSHKDAGCREKEVVMLKYMLFEHVEVIPTFQCNTTDCNKLLSSIPNKNWLQINKVSYLKISMLMDSIRTIPERRIASLMDSAYSISLYIFNCTKISKQINKN